MMRPVCLITGASAGIGAGGGVAGPPPGEYVVV